MAHNHSHRHHHHNHAMPSMGRVFTFGIVLNLIYVATEFLFGFFSNSMGLMSDAGHNLSDVASMLLSALALWLSHRKATKVYTYGFKKSTVLASVINAVILLVAVALILIESIEKLFTPEPVQGGMVMIVAGVGIVINGLTAWLFTKGKDNDLNVRSTYLHMLADTLVSVGVVVSGGIIYFTGWNFIDPVVGIAVAIIILFSTWSLLTESLRLALDGAPTAINASEAQDLMSATDGVTDVHHVHLWAISTTENALTAHVVLKEGADSEATRTTLHNVLAKAGITHATIELETADCCCAMECCK